MVKDKRFTLAYEKDNWWAVRDGDITLWKEEVVYLLNKQDRDLWEVEQMIERLLVFFMKWFEKEHGMNPIDFGLWWCEIGLGKTTFE